MIEMFTLFGRQFSIYQVLALLGVFASGLYACRQARRFGQDDNNMIEFLLWAGLGVLLGGHLLYGLVNYPLLFEALAGIGRLSFANQMQALAAALGGSVFYGGLLGGMAAGFLYLRLKKLDIPLYTDLAAPAIPLFHLFGRAGCFLGGCCYGVESPFGFVYRYSLVPGGNGVRRFPVQLLEAAFNLGLFVLLAALLRRGRMKGKLFRLYLCLYAVARFFLEFLRGDVHRGFVWGLSTSQIISLVLLAGALFSLGWERWQQRGARPA